MEFYKVLFSKEYSKKRGKFGIVDAKESFNEYLLKDEAHFPIDLFDDITLFLENEDGKEFADNQMSYFPWRLISSKMYKIIKEYANSENVYFHPVVIQSDRLGSQKYYVMHILKQLDVLDKDKTIYIDDTVHKPIVDVSKLERVHVFNFKEKTNTSAFCISSEIREEFEKRNITGCSYYKISPS